MEKTIVTIFFSKFPNTAINLDICNKKINTYIRYIYIYNVLTYVSEFIGLFSSMVNVQ